VVDSLYRRDLQACGEIQQLLAILSNLKGDVDWKGVAAASGALISVARMHTEEKRRETVEFYLKVFLRPDDHDYQQYGDLLRDYGETIESLCIEHVCPNLADPGLSCVL